MDQAVLELATRLLRDKRARVTEPRVRVLAELLDAGRALSHHDVQGRVEQAPDIGRLDRVTVYRVLDWLVDCELAHRVAGPDRVFRFSAQEGGSGAHGHFRCTSCERMFCMSETAGLGRTVRAMLPDGFSGEDIELTVSGRCAECAAP